MEISAVHGDMGDYRYEGLWWRMDGEVQWKAEVFLKDEISAKPAGAIRPAQRGAEDAEVRQSIETFIRTAEASARRSADPDRE